MHNASATRKVEKRIKTSHTLRGAKLSSALLRPHHGRLGRERQGEVGLLHLEDLVATGPKASRLREKRMREHKKVTRDSTILALCIYEDTM